MTYLFAILLVLFPSYTQAQNHGYDVAPIEEKEQQQMSPVAKILLSDDTQALKKMIDAGLDVNSRDEEGDTLLLFTLANNDNLEIAKMLLEAGADINAPSQRDGITPLLVATTMANELQKQAQKIYKNPAALKHTNISAGNMKNRAVHQMNYAVKLTKMLIEYGADVNRETPYGTPLMNASTNEWNKEIIDMLLEAGADVNKKDRNGRTALFYASAFNCNDIITKLLAAGADIEIKDIYGKSYMDAEKKDLVTDPEDI
ncbi:MAG: ankyrin repeat domain-containing protein [Alphaproteobacteria bacterium]|nr:ankyrin repeat domain-containing protein [Alphaproteobacteria bacterium]